MKLRKIPILDLINKTFKFKVGSWDIAPTYWQAVAIVVLLFLLVWTLARLRHMYVGWSLKGLWPSVLFGFILAVILEGFFIIGGKTLFTELLGWKNPPKPISTALDEGKSKLVNVLGEETEDVSVESIIIDYSSLSSKQAREVVSQICE